MNLVHDAIKKMAGAQNRQTEENKVEMNWEIDRTVIGLGRKLRELQPEWDENADVCRITDEELRQEVGKTLVTKVIWKTEPAHRRVAEQAISRVRKLFLHGGRDPKVQEVESRDFETFPSWFQARLVIHALEMLRADTMTNLSGEPAQALELCVMLCANVATFRDKEQRKAFFEAISDLVSRVEEYSGDPFIRDRVLMASRIFHEGEYRES